MKKALFISMALMLLAVAVLAGCSNNNGNTSKGDNQTNTQKAEETTANNEGAQQSKEKINISMGIRSFPGQGPAAADLWQWKKYEEISNVKVDWVEVSSDTLLEKKGVMLASGEYPDAFYGYWGFTNDDIVKYGSQGTFIRLNDLIDKYAPNITEMFVAHPEWKASMTAPDGNIYSLPWIDEAILPSSLRYYVNQKWLDNLSLKAPETLDEFAEVLKQFRDKDANGNGDATDEIPFSLPNGGGFVGLLVNTMLGAYGMGEGGLPAAQQLLYIDKDGQLQTTVNDPKMKELWQYLNMMIEENLMPKTIFSGIEYDKWVNDGKEDKIGSFAFVHPYYLSSGPEAENFKGINVLEGPHGDKVMSYVDSAIRGTASFEITDKNKHPERTMQWIDYAYGEVGRMFFKYGIEGETYTMVEGQPKFVDKIRETEKGDGLGIFQYIYNWYGGYVPGWELPADQQSAATLEPGAVVKDQFKTTAEDAEKWKPKEFLPRFFPTPENSTRTSAILTDVNKYVSESQAKFVLGEWDLDGADWDKYVATLKKMGIEDYLTIARAEYEQYKNSK